MEDPEDEAEGWNKFTLLRDNVNIGRPTNNSRRGRELRDHSRTEDDQGD